MAVYHLHHFVSLKAVLTVVAVKQSEQVATAALESWKRSVIAVL